MKVLVIGRGGREHALCEKIKESPLVSRIYAAPGNPGMISCAELLPYTESEQEELIDFAQTEKINLVLIGPEQPLMDGLADRLQQAGLRVFAPTKKAAEIEGSKAFAKRLMTKHGIPTARYGVFDDHQAAREYLDHCPIPVVIKADGLAAGKGVVVAETRREAEAAVREMLVEKKHGAASSVVVIEEFLVGEEFSLMAFVHGDLVVPLQIAQDHKRAYDGDTGPNTGGMGAYSPVPQISPEIIKEAVDTVLQPAVHALLAEGRFFSGVLYAGLILTAEGPKVIEFNARLGDPETQVVLPRLKSDLIEVILKLMAGEKPELDWDPRPMLGVVVACDGYPQDCAGRPRLGAMPLAAADLHLYYSGVALGGGGELIATGGRTFLLAASGCTLAAAQNRVYGVLNDLILPGLFYRTDIGRRALEKV